MSDLWVLNSQIWMNKTFSGVSGYSKVTEDGVSGWGTMFALTRALQSEIGITSLSDNFGDGTAAAFVSRVGTVTASSGSKVIGILQCALWCKGYTGGTDFGRWTDVIPASVGNVRADLGLAQGAAVDVKLVKSLLTLDAYVKVAGGRDLVRAGQQWLNGRYAGRQDYSLVPCDGLFTRDVQRGLMLAIQYEIGMADGVANGNFGPGTQAGLKSSGGVSSGSSDGGTAFVSLFQLALAFNGYDVTRSGVFSATTRTTTLDFQRFLEIAATGDGDYGTWAALLVSTGDPDRPVSMIDTTSTMSPAFSAQMKQAGYDIVGRYLTVTGKAIARGELDTIFTAGLRVVPIFQNFNNGPEYFTRALGLDHGRQAAIRARQLGFQGGTTIFFAVDYDAFATEIDLLIAPYFQGVAEGLSVSVEKKYGVGVYATRNIGARIAERGLASSVWVSGMSTGYSGNLGFAMPPTWSYNQIQEVHSLNIDRNAVSTRARPATRADVARTPEQSDAVRNFFWALVRHSVYAESAVSKQPLVPSTAASEFVLDRLMEAKYHDVPWLAYAPYAESTPGMPPQTALAYTTARLEYQANAGNIQDIVDSYGGDAEHMAATARAANLWGLSAGKPVVEFGDLGGWSLDTVTLWKNYRLGSEKSITTFVNQHLGAPGSPAEFPEDDLIADADGWLLAKGLIEGKGLADTFRELLVSFPSWRDRLGLFLDGRFGSPATLSAAVGALFGPTWLWPDFPRSQFIDGQSLPNASELVELRSAVTTRLHTLAGRPARF